ncbi:phage major tail tube protein [Limnobaculum xujianqingii]|uniref:phage major tail tube protein n=1 Tax=Limnobaculum xujianqingii TaxID=2738837 RepID=UPI0015B86A7B|nr:phage major tail tube protein [Limnobaculum xujianqingii]
MALPRKLKYLNTFVDGDNWVGVIESMTLPKLTRKLENYRGGGMNGSAPADLGLDDDALSLEWAIGGLHPLIYKQLGAPTAAAVPIRFMGSYQRDDTGDTSAVEVVMRGRHKEVDGGELKQGENTSTKISTICTYYKLAIDGEDIVEIDTINMIEIIGGDDRLKQHRKNIGL